MTRVVDRHWFGLAELVCAVGSVALVLLQPNLFGWPLLLMALPWSARLLSGRFPIRLIGLEIWFALFLLTAGIGVWAAYDSAAAVSKFWVLVSAVVLFYAVANLRPEHLPLTLAGLGGVGVWLISFFLLTVERDYYRADLEFLQPLMAAWFNLRPSVTSFAHNQNIFGGLLAMLIPLTAASGLLARERKQQGGVLWAVLAVGMMLAGLLITSTRAAWFALLAGGGLWAVWWLAKRFGRAPKLVFSGLVIVGVVVVVAVIATVSPFALFSRLPGLNDGSVRLTLIRDTFDLVGDFAVTGGGLDAFAGLYSRYALVIPFYVLGYGHNFFLDVALEQGLFGFLALQVIYAGSFWLMLKNWRAKESSNSSILPQAILVSLAVVLLHGLFDDALYGERGTPFLFLLPALAVALTTPNPAALTVRARVWNALTPHLAGLTLIALAALSVWFWQPWRAELYANVGAVEMARHELNGFPVARWDERKDLSDLKLARRYLSYALELDPNNRAATYRLGLIAMLEGNFAEATPRLEAALTGRSIPRGLAKALGYSHTWLGNYTRASELLMSVPEARYEMQVYSWWWGTQNRPDLAERAAEMELRLAALGAEVNSDPLNSQP